MNALITSLLPIIMSLAGNKALMEGLVPLLAKFAPFLIQMLSPGREPAAAPQLAGPDALVSFDAKWLQESLGKLLNIQLKVTGKYDDETKAAVTVYQRAKGEAVLGAADGWAGFKTCVAIWTDLQKAAPR